MKLLSIGLGVVLLIAACGGAAVPSPTAAPTATAARTPTPAPTPSPVAQVVFSADLKATNVVPQIADDEKNATGTATITLDLTRDSGGKVTSATAKIDFTVSNLPATSKIVAALAHEGAAGANGAGKINTGITADTAIAVTGGTVTFTKSGIAVSDATFIQGLLDNPANYYFLVHSALHASGVSRGQLTKKA